MSLIQQSSFHSDLLPGLVKEWFDITPVDLQPLWNVICKAQSSDTAYENHTTATPMGSLVKKGSGSALTLDTTQEAYTVRYEHITYALGFAITKEAVRDGHAFKDARRFVEQLKRGAAITKEILAANLINFAGTSGYTQLGGDQQVLASASHPTRSGSQSNILSSGADLSEASLEAIRTQVENAKDNRGLRIKIMVKDLLINPAQRALAHRILKSEKQIDTLNNANFLKDTGVVKNIVVNPYFTSTTQWQVTTTQENGLMFLVRQEAEMDTDNDFMTKNGMYSIDMRCTTSWDNFKGLYISL